MNVGDPRKIDAVRALVARMHDGPASVVDYEGNGFCWGFSLVGSAHPHTWQHGGVVDVGDSSACVAACATYPDICAERFVRRSLWESRSNGRYKDVVNGSSHANTADNDFYTPGGSVQAAVQRKGGWCGSAATGVLADNIGLDYVVIFEARKHVNNGPMLIKTNRRNGGKVEERVLHSHDDVVERVGSLRANGQTRGAYLLHVPGHYMSVQVGAFAVYGAGSSRRPRPGITLGDPANDFYQRLVRAQATRMDESNGEGTSGGGGGGESGGGRGGDSSLSGARGDRGGGRGGSRLAVRSGEGTNGGPGGRGRGGNGGSTLGDAFASISASISASAQRNAMKRKRQQQGLA